MQVQVMAPPRAVRYRSRRVNRRYADMAKLLVDQPGVWLRLDPKDIAGATYQLKQCAVAQATRRRGIHAQTTVQDNQLSIRLMIPDGVAEADVGIGEGD